MDIPRNTSRTRRVIASQRGPKPSKFQAKLPKSHQNSLQNTLKSLRIFPILTGRYVPLRSFASHFTVFCAPLPIVTESYEGFSP